MERRKNKKKEKHNLENTSFSPDNYTAVPPPLLSSSKTLTCTFECVCRMQAPGLMCFRSATEGQKAFLRKNKKRAARGNSLDSEARREPERQRDQGQLESERRGWGEAEPDWTGRVSGGWWQSWIWTCDLNGRSSVGRSVGRGWKRFRHSLPRRRGGPGVCAARRQTRALPWAGCLAACARPAWSWREERAAWRSRRPSPRTGRPAAGAGPPCHPARPAAGSRPWPCRRRMWSPWHCWFCWAERGGR